MSGTPPPDPDSGTPPPEVPDEFADVYRAAYERALAEQSDGPTHREPPAAEPAAGEDGAQKGKDWSARLPTRQGRLRVGAHRGEDEPVEPVEGSWLDRLRASRALVPVLLVLFVLVMVVCAYLLGRAFASQVSSSSVIGPSPTSASSICAPKAPVSTCTPAARSPATTAS